METLTSKEEAIALSKEIKVKIKRRDKLSEEIFQKQTFLKEICPHEEIIEKQSHVPGGYLDRAEYHTEWFCDLCGKLMDSKVKYGGFG